MARSFLLVLLVAFSLFLFAGCTTLQEVSKIPETQEKIQPSTESKIEEMPKQEISAGVKDLLERHKTRVKSIYYKYRGPETGTNFHEFYVKGDKIKYKPYLELKSLDREDSYDTIFIDKTAQTAESYCMAAYCAYKGKKADLEYGDAYISTIFDWISVASAKKVGEEVIDDRNTWKLETGKGILWVDTFYGIPLKAESNGKTYKFEQISVNSVQDSDVAP